VVRADIQRRNHRLAAAVTDSRRDCLPALALTVVGDHNPRAFAPENFSGGAADAS